MLFALLCETFEWNIFYLFWAKFQISWTEAFCKGMFTLNIIQYNDIINGLYLNDIIFAAPGLYIVEYQHTTEPWNTILKSSGITAYYLLTLEHLLTT